MAWTRRQGPQHLKRAHPEQDLQMRVIAWAHKVHPVMAEHLVHIPSGIPYSGRRAAVAGGIRQGMGAPSGFPDLVLFVPVAPFHGAVLELKAPGKYPSTDQRAWLTRLDALGYACGWTDTYEDAVTFIMEYQGGLFERRFDVLKRWRAQSS